MQKVTWQVSLSGDRRTARLETSLDGHHVATAEMDSGEVAILIDLLRGLRAGMLDPVPPRLDVGSRTPIVEDPSWQIEPDLGNPSVWMALRDPGTGWTGFRFPKAEVQKIARLFLANS